MVYYNGIRNHDIRLRCTTLLLNDDNTVLGGYAQSEMNGKFAREKEGMIMLSD
jgi:hypothetical protein